MKKPLLAVAAAAVLLSLSATGVAAERTCCYVYDSESKLVRDSGGECVRSGTWAPECAICECDPSVCPKPEAPPPEPVVKRFTLQADAFFDFDKATLKPEGKAKLDELVAKMKEFKEVREVKVSAYTDRIGSDAYNLRLSDRRAMSVKDYMVSRGISSSSIQAEGFGEANPVVGCEGVRGRRQLIECLAPNRRAEIEMIVIETVYE
jgi:OOP family OmpA-OmpF porin